jgi:membrane protein YqaA with SNARE-associated domain
VAIEELIARGSSPIALLGVAFVYSIVVAAFLPFPAEAVLAIPLALPYPWYVSFALVILIAATGKAVGSVIALQIGYSVSHATPIVRLTERIPYYKRFKERTVTGFVQRYSYVGLGIALSIPFLPDTAPIYAFSVLDNNPVLFAVAAFVGTIVRLVIILVVAGGAVAVGT